MAGTQIKNSFFLLVGRGYLFESDPYFLGTLSGGAFEAADHHVLFDVLLRNGDHHIVLTILAGHGDVS